MSFGVKTNERPGHPRRRCATCACRRTRRARCSTSSAARSVQAADEILQFGERDAAIVVRKCLRSAVANAGNNDEIDPDELYVSACFADEGPTLKRWRPRAAAGPRASASAPATSRSS